MLVSCCMWALGEGEEAALTALRDMGLEAVDIRPSMLRRDGGRRLEALDLRACCMAASHEKPAGARLDMDNAATRQLRRHVEGAIGHIASLGGEWAYLVPDEPLAASSLKRYAEEVAAIADYGQTVGVKVCVEHFPGTVLPTVEATLDFVRGTGHPNLYLLFDIGHAQMSGEDPARVLAKAGDRLAYVHLDDNDGVDDLHLALTDGVQTAASLRGLFDVLQGIGYDGPVSLEMKSDLPDPLDAIRRSYDLVTTLVRG